MIKAEQWCSEIGFFGAGCYINIIKQIQRDALLFAASIAEANMNKNIERSKQATKDGYALLGYPQLTSEIIKCEIEAAAQKL